MPPRSSTAPFATWRPQTPRRRDREAPSPSRPSRAPQRHPFPTGSARPHRGLRRHDDRRPTRPERHPVPLYGAGGRHPSRDGQPPRPGRRARAEPNLRPTFALSGKSAPAGPATSPPKAVRPEEALVAPEDRSSALPTANPYGRVPWLRLSGRLCRSSVVPPCSRVPGKRLAKIRASRNNKTAKNRTFLLMKSRLPHNSCAAYPRFFPQATRCLRSPYCASGAMQARQSGQATFDAARSAV